jgi:PAS domain S-box-containing protein
MSKRLSSILTTGLGVSSWPAALIGIVVIKAALSLAVKQGSFLASYSGISYFLLLVLAAGFAVRNAVQNTLGSRPFWMLLATGYGLWAVHQSFSLYYELGLHVELPNTSIADSLLFFHVVPLMAALTTVPHRNVSESTPYRAVLNSLLLALSWSFLYGYIVFPYQFLFSSTAPFSYAVRFDTLYFLENLALVSALAILSLRVESPWKRIYLHLLGASALYTLSSTVANLATDSGGYVNGKLYGLGLTASVCWFVWVPLCARQVPGAEASATRSDDSQGSQASVWPMLVIVLISIPIAWELFRRNENAGLRTLRLLIAIATIVCVASAAYIREYLGRRELASLLGLADERLRLAMEAGKSVGWDWDIKSGRDIVFGDLKTTFGISSTTHVGTLEDFRSRVHPDDRERVRKAGSDAMRNHQPYAAEFRVLWPDGTVRWIAAKGKFYYSRRGEAKRMLGTGVDITDQKRMEEALRESEARLRLAAETGRMYAFEWNIVTDAVVQSAEPVQMDGTPEPVRTTGQQMLAGVHPDDLPRVTAAIGQLTPQNPICSVSYRMLRADGSRTWVEETARGFFDEHGKMLRMVGMVADVNERKLAEEALSSVNRRVIEAEEQERNRIAKELHEDIGQRLALLAIEIDELKTDAPRRIAEVRSRMEALWRQTVEILNDVKASAHELHSPRLEYLGIDAVMRCFCREFSERKEVEIDFKSDGLPSLVELDVSVCLFRVLQEALHNAVKHSGVEQFEVRLWEASNEVHLTIRDSGAGFDLEGAMNQKGLGLISMRERLKLLRGTFSIESQPSAGTTVHACVPLRAETKSMRAAG